MHIVFSPLLCNGAKLKIRPVHCCLEELQFASANSYVTRLLRFGLSESSNFPFPLLSLLARDVLPRLSCFWLTAEAQTILFQPHV